MTTMNEEMYRVSINSTNHKVVNCISEFDPIGVDEIQVMVDKLMREKMITLDESIVDKDGNVEVGICIWEIGDDTDDLYIETYHTHPYLPVDELFDDYDRTMKYDEFLNL